MCPTITDRALVAEVDAGRFTRGDVSDESREGWIVRASSSHVRWLPATSHARQSSS